MRERKVYLKIAVNLFVGLAGTGILLFAVPKVLSFFMPFVIGWCIAMVANPLVRFMEEKTRIVRKHGSVIVIGTAITGILGLLYLGVTVLVRETVRLVADLPGLYHSAENQIQLALANMRGIYAVMPEGMREFVDSFSVNLKVSVWDFIKGIQLPTVSDAGFLVGQVAEIFFMMFITLLSSCFFVAEREKMIEIVKKSTPLSVQNKYHMFIKSLRRALGGYLKAQLKIMLILTAVMWLGLGSLKIKYSFFLAFGIAFLDLLPVFGTGTVFWPWALIDMVAGNYIRAIGLMVIYLICQIIKQVVQPKLMGDSMGISPLTTLFLMFIGYRIGGVLGMVAGIPAGMVIISLYQMGFFDNFLKSMRILINDVNDFRK